MTNLDIIQKKREKNVNLCLSNWTKQAYENVTSDIASPEQS